ncbi:MAG TPA: hypothetical protein VI387_08850 [Candidatus Brocadiales bacterium]|nr:hypothetical protein [Candidatus Brocadiales bacterium]
MKAVSLLISILILLPGISYAFEAPTPYPEKLRRDVELFINVYDAIFDAKRIKSKRAVELWDALVDHEAYKEVNLEKPYEFWDWKQARAVKEDFIEQAHSLLEKGTISDLQKALYQASKIDGYEVVGGMVVVYTRYTRTYQNKDYFGFAIFKIKNAGAPLDIKKWNEPPYASNWKISDMRWKTITQPAYNKKVFENYPIVDW